MKKRFTIQNILFVLALLFIAWISFSVWEVLVKNTMPGGIIFKYNFFNMLYRAV